MNTTPYEVIAAPFTVWSAPVATAFPEINAAPAVAWIKVGTSGPLNYEAEGVTVEHKQSMNFWRSLGDSGSRKVFRNEEDLVISLTLVDISLEQYALAINGNDVTTVVAATGEAGYKKIGLSRGLTVHTRALLVRGPSPYGEDYNLQYEVPIAVQTSSPQVVYKRESPAGLKLEWTALVDPSAATPDAVLGRILAQHQAPLA